MKVMEFEDAAATSQAFTQEPPMADADRVGPARSGHSLPDARDYRFPTRTRREAERSARAVFRERYGRASAILFFAPAHDETRTYAFVEALEELGQGEHMFVSDGLKIAAQAHATRTYITHSSFRWWLHRRSYRKWKQRTERALSGV